MAAGSVVYRSRVEPSVLDGGGDRDGAQGSTSRACGYGRRMPARRIVLPCLALVLLGVAGCSDRTAEARALATQACDFRDEGIGEGTPIGTAMRSLSGVLSRAADTAAEATAKDDAYLELTDALTRAGRSASTLSALLDENGDDLAGWPAEATERWGTAVGDLTEHLATAEMLCRIEDAR